MLGIDVKVKGCEIEISQPLVASGTAGKVVLNFLFDAEWQGLAKTAIFNLARGNLLVPLEKDSCILPSEVLAKSGSYKLGVFGTDGESTLATHFCLLRVEHGAAANGTRAVNYSPSLYEQFSARFAKFENISAKAASGEAASAFLAEENGKLVLSLTLPRGEQGLAGKDGADYILTDEDKADIAALITADIETALDEIIALQEQYIGGMA